MNKNILTLVIALLMTGMSWAGNSRVTVEQVTDSVTLTDDVDYLITSATAPFAATGNIDIVNTEHAVLIFQNIRPSAVVKSYLKNVTINGKAARNGTNCQVKMYAQGAIVMPYASNIKPLTAYSEKNFEGSSYNNFSLGNSGGFMNSISGSWNNMIRSFKLKRGYMVTFAVGKSGWGYSRCFIADKEDLEIASLPNVLDGKISSYRIFQWYDAQKKGLASNGNSAANSALKTSWCYDWGQGNASLLPDVEWVPNHIYEDWPPVATCGSVTGSCHMKTNNEPGNSSDDHPQDVATVLGNWENLMRTGMRLCSESSHDGSMNHLKAFIDSIDARGWRCDILDLHCYWEGGFNNLNWYSDNYGNGRPIWISEWIWGSSWNGGKGAFRSGVTDAQILENTKSILTTLNNNPRVERYAYWNSESKAHIYENGKLTALGEYYAQMETGLAYNKANEYIPKVVYKAPSKLTGAYTESTGAYRLTWTDPNGDMLDSIVVEYKKPGSNTWAPLATVATKDKSSKSDLSYNFSHTPEGNGSHAYRIAEYAAGRKQFTTNEVSLNRIAAEHVGDLQYGELNLGTTDACKVALSSQEKAPYVVVGLISNKNTSNGITNQVQQLGKADFSFRFFPWQKTTPVDFKNAESASFLVLPADTVIQLSADMMLLSQSAGNIAGDEVQVVFPQAFPEGVVPVVVAQQNTTSTTDAPVTVRVYDVTNTGFKAHLVRQEAVTGTFKAQNVNYFAATPGQVAIGQGKLLTVGSAPSTLIGGTAWKAVALQDANGEAIALRNPYIVAAPQTDNYDKASMLRQQSLISNDEGDVTAMNIRRQVDATNTTEKASNSANTNGDYVGWFIVSDDPNGTGDEAPVIVTTGLERHAADLGFSISVSDRAIHAQGLGVRAFTPNGTQVALGRQLPKGVYIVTNGQQAVKVQVK